MDIENMDPAHFSTLSADDRMALLDHGELPAAAAPAAQEGAAPEPQQAEPQSAEPAPAQPSVEEAKRGNPEVPLRQLREEGRQKDAQIAQFQQAMSDPSFVAHLAAQHGLMPQAGGQQAAAQGPELAIEDPGAINHLISNHPLVKQLVQHNQQLTALANQQQQQSQLQQARQQFPGMDDNQAPFDSAFPSLANVKDPVEKHLIMEGLKWSDPAYRAAQIAQAAKPMAQASLEQALGNGKKGPVTLGNAPAARGNEPSIDIGAMSPDDFSKLSEGDLDKMRAQY